MNKQLLLQFFLKHDFALNFKPKLLFAIKTVQDKYTFQITDMVFFIVSWREGVITEKNKKDETTFTIHFPGMYIILLNIFVFYVAS